MLVIVKHFFITEILQHEKIHILELIKYTVTPSSSRAETTSSVGGEQTLPGALPAARSFQGSETIDSDRFCQCSLRLHGGKTSGAPYSVIPAPIIPI